MSCQSGDDGSSSSENVSRAIDRHQEKPSHLELCLGPEGDVSHCEPTTRHLSSTALLKSGYQLLAPVPGHFEGNVSLARSTKGRSLAVAKATTNQLELELLQTATNDRAHLPRLLSHVSLSSSYLLICEHTPTDLELVISGLRPPSCLPLDWVRLLVAGVSDGLSFLHCSRVSHRALRTEHILISERGALLAGLSHCVRCSQRALALPRCNVSAGELLYWSPEMLDRTHHTYNPLAADMYSLGVLLYRLLFGRTPHPLTSDPNKARQLKYSLRMSETPWRVDEQAMTLMRLLLSTRPMFRPTAAQVKHHQWTRAHNNVRSLLRPFK